jgi:hypothetical protein
LRARTAFHLATVEQAVPVYRVLAAGATTHLNAFHFFIAIHHGVNRSVERLLLNRLNQRLLVLNRTEKIAAATLNRFSPSSHLALIMRVDHCVEMLSRFFDLLFDQFFYVHRVTLLEYVYRHSPNNIYFVSLSQRPSTQTREYAAYRPTQQLAHSQRR